MMENFPTNKEGTSERHAEDLLRGVRVDYARRDERAKSEIEEQSSVKEQLDLLHSTSAELARLKTEIEKEIMSGALLSPAGSERKNKMEGLLSKAEYKVYHAFAQPEEPWRVEMLQENWEKAAEKLKREHIDPTEQMVAALNGETTAEEASGIVKDRHELEQIGDVIESRENMDTEEVSELRNDLSAALNRLRELQPRIEDLAKERALSPEEKEQKLKQYSAGYDEYKKLQEEVKGLLERVRKQKFIS